MPDHTHTVTVPAVYGQGHGAGTPLVATAIDTVFETTGAEESNPIYGNSDTVQPNAVKKLLYICVGNTTNYEGLTDVVNQGMEILEQVNQGIESRVKLDGSNAEFIYVTEAYQNGTSWYRIWSDGWCEQGGKSSTNLQTLEFLKQFITIPNVTATKYTSSTSHEGVYGVRVVGLTLTGCDIYFDSYTADVNGYWGSWQASGYIW